MNLIVAHSSLITILGAILGFVMAFGIGANDVSNAMGTSVGAGTITAKQAVLVAVVFEFSGAYFAGGQVTHTIKSGIINLNTYANDIDTLLIGMLACLMAASIWLILASIKGWPVSTTHALIGSFLGFALVTMGPSTVKWYSILAIIGSWFITPFISGLIAFCIFKTTQKFIFDSDNPLQKAKDYGPYYMGITTFILSLVTIKKGLVHLGINLTIYQALLISLSISVTSIIICYFYFKTIKFTNEDEDQNSTKRKHNYDHSPFATVERIFAILMLLTACSMAFAHGSNDVSNSVGPLSVITAVIESSGIIDSSQEGITWWILPLGGIGMVVGMATFGYRVMGTIGNKITHLTPSRGFSAEFATATTVIIASGTGLPISTTQTLVGAVLGVGFARGIAALNLKMIGKIFSSWVITLPAGAILSIISYYMIRFCF